MGAGFQWNPGSWQISPLQQRSSGLLQGEQRAEPRSSPLGQAAHRKQLLEHARLRRAIDCEKIIDPVVSFDEAPDAYEEYVDRNPQKSVKLGIAFI